VISRILRFAIAAALAAGAVVAATPFADVPAVAATPDAQGAGGESCTVASVDVTAVRAFLTPGSPVVEDVAFNRDDPDADDSPIELIRFPDETALWVEAGIGGTSLQGGRDLAVPQVRAFAFTGPERQDRAVSDSIVRLYCSMFDRRPNSFELEYWSGRYWNGLPLVSIAEAFTHAHEFVGRYGVVTDDDLVALLYRDVLGREPGRGGVAATVAKLDSGDMHRGEVIVQFTESDEYVRRTATVRPEKPILPYPDVGSGRRIILSDSGQRVWLVESTGELAKTHQVSGRRGIPGVGRYNVYSKSRYAWAPYDGITMEFMVRFARGEWPYGFHSIPVWPDESPLQTPAQLGTHRSGGCIRQLWDDASAVFEWAEVGDRVVLIP
jgi:hypothetical protein